MVKIGRAISRNNADVQLQVEMCARVGAIEERTYNADVTSPHRAQNPWSTPYLRTRVNGNWKDDLYPIPVRRRCDSLAALGSALRPIRRPEDALVLFPYGPGGQCDDCHRSGPVDQQAAQIPQSVQV